MRHGLSNVSELYFDIVVVGMVLIRCSPIFCIAIALRKFAVFILFSTGVPKISKNGFVNKYRKFNL